MEQSGRNTSTARRRVAAAAAGDIAAVRTLLDAGADPNTPDDDDHGPLCAAAIEDHEAVVRLLLERGADANWADAYQFVTPLMSAACRGDAGIIRLFLRHGARVAAEDDSTARRRSARPS